MTSRLVSQRAAHAMATTLVLVAAVQTHRAQTAQPIDTRALSEMRWRMIGPHRASRTKAVAGIPSQPHTFYIGVVNGGVWKTTDAGRTWTPIFDDQPTGSIGAIAIAPSNPERRSTSAAAKGSSGPTSRPATASTSPPTPAARGRISALRDGQQIAAHHRRPDESRSAVRRRARSSVRTERRARHLSLDRRRPHVSEGAVQGREHRRRRRRVRSGEPEHRLRRAVGSAPGSVGERRVQRARERPVQVDRRRHDVAAADARAADVGRRSARAHRHHRRAELAVAPLRDGRSADRRPASIARTTPARAGTRVNGDPRVVARPNDACRGARASDESRHRLRADDRRVEIHRRRQDVHGVSRRAGRRRLSEDLDQPDACRT